MSKTNFSRKLSSSFKNKNNFPHSYLLLPSESKFWLLNFRCLASPRRDIIFSKPPPSYSWFSIPCSVARASKSVIAFKILARESRIFSSALIFHKPPTETILASLSCSNNLALPKEAKSFFQISEYSTSFSTKVSADPVR